MERFSGSHTCTKETSMTEYTPCVLSMFIAFFASDNIETTARRTGFVKRTSKITQNVWRSKRLEKDKQRRKYCESVWDNTANQSNWRRLSMLSFMPMGPQGERDPQRADCYRASRTRRAGRQTGCLWERWPARRLLYRLEPVGAVASGGPCFTS